MQLSFTEKKNIRKSFGKLKESLSIPNLIEVQKNSYKELTEFNVEAAELTKGFDRVFKSIFPIEDLNDKATLEYVSYRLEKPKFDVEECIARGLTYSSADEYVRPLAIHSSTSNFGFSNLYETYSKVALSFKSSIGKILLKTLSKPLVSSAASTLNSVNSL